MRSTPSLPGIERGGARTVLDDRARGCTITYEPDFLLRDEADRWMARLSREAPFGVEAPVMFGKATPVRRRSCSFGDPGTRYRYSGVERVANPWPEGFSAILDALRERTGRRFTFALCNLYPDGDAGLGWHADDERDLERDAPIASLSLGAERDFAVRLGREGGACLTLPLAHGSLLIMGGALQRFYQHRVPVRARCAAPRINLTFRMMR
ncbi:MAG: alpha-ketoglutarate-dependent dioxygenase AlkB [Polyangiales bacterium]